MKQKATITTIKGLQQTLRGSTSRERMLHRLHTIALVLSGKSASEAAVSFGDSPRAVAYWVKRYSEKGIAGLEEDQRPGRPSKLDQSQMKRLQTFLRKSSRQSKPVNGETLAAFILSEFGIHLTTRQGWRIIDKLKS